MRLRHVLVLVVVALAASPAPAGATPPPGFSQTEVATGLSQPTALAPAPDGRLFIAEKGGTVKVLDGGALKTVLSLPVDTASERGLIGIALHPAFPGVPRVYVHYTATSPTVHNRVSWFTLAGDTLSGETVVLDLPTLGAGNHNGGAIHFGPDGDLYVGVGENAVPANAPDLSTPLGKILRVDPDGAIPPDNPFVGVAGADPRIWARGLRNPFTFGFQPGTGVMLINDVGAAAWEEVNVGHAGADYGWPATEGPTSNPIYIGPLYAYPHPDGCAIVGAAFPDPDANRLGADYFFGDLCAGFVRSLDVESATAAPFASALGSITDLAVGADGALYVADLDGRVVRIAPDGPPPVIPEAPIPILLPVGALGAGALTLRRRRRP